MVSSMSLLGMSVTLVLSIVLPIVFLIILMKGRRGVFPVWAVGTLGFIIPQLVIRIPLLQILGMQPAFIEFAETNAFVYGLLLALTAALFETTGRLVVFKALRKKLSYKTGMAAGAGHGAIESIMLVGMTYISNIIISLMINSNQLSMITMGNSEVEQELLQLLTETSSGVFFFAGLERVFVMVFHIAMSILLVYFIMKKKSLQGFLLVTGFHFALDFILALMLMQGFTLIYIEGFMFIAALASLVFIIKIRPFFGEKQETSVKSEVL